MAQKRMFDKRITDSDKFIDLPNSSKALYFMAGMNADDRGFFQPRKLQKECGFSDDDFKILIAKGYFITFESGVMIITDWNKNNWLDSRRLTETEYLDELNMLKLINDKYEFKPSNDACLASAKHSLSQYSIEEYSIEKESKKKEKSFDEIINEYTLCVDLKNELLEFLKMRKLKKKPLTSHALNLALKKLDKLAVNDETKIQIVQQSIEKCWDTFYEIKNTQCKISNTDITIV